jgi:hypothetical protein
VVVCAPHTWHTTHPHMHILAPWLWIYSKIELPRPARTTFVMTHTHAPPVASQSHAGAKASPRNE